MNKDILSGKWTQLRGDVQKRWGKLTNDHLDVINGDRLKLVGKIQEAYGVAVDDAERQVSEFETTYSSPSKNDHAA